MNTSGFSLQFVKDPEAALALDNTQLRQEPGTRTHGRIGEDDEKPAPARQVPDRFERIFACTCVDNEPSSGSALAAGHPASYSAAMTAAERLQVVREGIQAAARAAKRDSRDVTLIAVSKTRSAEEIEGLIEAGQRDFGESRVQEAIDKWPTLLSRHSDVSLHCIGRLQSNKAAQAVRLFDSIHSVDRTSLLDAVVKEAEKADRNPNVYVQVNIGDEAPKGGCPIGEVGGLVEAVRETPLPLAGLMCIPPLGLEPSPFFALLAKIAREHGVEGLSMGMSADYKAAVMLGATAVRVGTALFEDDD